MTAIASVLRRSTVLMAGAIVTLASHAGVQHNALSNNALQPNALTANALSNNALSNNALQLNALTSNGLSHGGATPVAAPLGSYQPAPSWSSSTIQLQQKR